MNTSQIDRIDRNIMEVVKLYTQIRLQDLIAQFYYNRHTTRKHLYKLQKLKLVSTRPFNKKEYLVLLTNEGLKLTKRVSYT